MINTETPARLALPAAPATLEATGLSFDTLLQLIVKTLHFAGELTGSDLAARVGLEVPVIEPCLDLLKRERHCEIVGGGVLGSPTYRYRLTDAGRIRAALFFEQNQYVGRAPVPIEQYRKYMKALSHASSERVTRPAVREAFAHLVLNERVIDQLGPAISSRHSLFIYGPPGNGKTVISQAIRNLLAGSLGIPHAISVEGHIIRVFDPVNHEPIAAREEGEGLHREVRVDHRWVECRRPLVTVGGELTLAGLELGQGGVGFYRAPLQAMANGGVLVIDDFGRQSASPRDLLNRWIVPLESRVDFLTLASGQKVEMPFEVLVVFATNLKPAELVDEAFLRRIQYKVFAQSPTVEEFIRIFENYCRDQAIGFDRAIVERLLETELGPRGIQLRGCQPRDLVDHAIALAAYLDQPRALTLALLAEACAAYFVDDRETAQA
jgi:predicted ATPase with chaperone activity